MAISPGHDWKKEQEVPYRSLPNFSLSAAAYLSLDLVVYAYWSALNMASQALRSVVFSWPTVNDRAEID